MNYGRQRTLARLQSARDGREVQKQSVLSRLASPFVDVYHQFVQELSSLSLPFKAGLAAAIGSVLVFAGGPLSVFNGTGAWAVVTVGTVTESNVGLTLSQGINQTLGCLAAAALALLVMFLGPMWGDYESYFVVVCVFLGAALVTMCKSRMDVRWNLGATATLIIFHILILSKGEMKDKMKTPELLLVVILIGFFAAALVNISVAPKFAGTVINELLARNFDRTGDAIERSVVAYREGKELEHVLPHVVEGDSGDKDVHLSYKEIVADNSEVGKLLKAVPFEPCHGKFFWGYPWHLYKHMTENLRVVLYDVAELDSCLHSEIQAPVHLREMFEDEFECIGEECARVFRNLGESVRSARAVHCHSPLQKAEEGALILEHKIAKYIDTLLGDNGRAVSEIARKDPIEREELDVIEENVTVSFQEAIEDSTFALPEDDLGTSQPPLDRSDSDGSSDGSKSASRPRLADRHQGFIKRRESMNRNWDTTVQRVSALSLIKFASLLIEVVAKTRYVVTIVEELEVEVRLHGHGDTFAADTPNKQGNQLV